MMKPLRPRRSPTLGGADGREGRPCGPAICGRLTRQDSATLRTRQDDEMAWPPYDKALLPQAASSPHDDAAQVGGRGTASLLCCCRSLARRDGHAVALIARALRPPRFPERVRPLRGVTASTTSDARGGGGKAGTERRTTIRGSGHTAMRLAFGMFTKAWDSTPPQYGITRLVEGDRPAAARWTFRVVTRQNRRQRTDDTAREAITTSLFLGLGPDQSTRPCFSPCCSMLGDTEFHGAHDLGRLGP